MSDLYRIHDEPEAVKRPDDAFYSEKGWLVPVEPVGTLNIGPYHARYIDGKRIGPGTYLIVEADDA